MEKTSPSTTPRKKSGISKNERLTTKHENLVKVVRLLKSNPKHFFTSAELHQNLGKEGDNPAYYGGLVRQEIKTESRVFVSKLEDGLQRYQCGAGATRLFSDPSPTKSPNSVPKVPSLTDEELADLEKEVIMNLGSIMSHSLPNTETKGSNESKNSQIVTTMVRDRNCGKK